MCLWGGGGGGRWKQETGMVHCMAAVRLYAARPTERSVNASCFQEVGSQCSPQRIVDCAPRCCLTSKWQHGWGALAFPGYHAMFDGGQSVTSHCAATVTPGSYNCSQVKWLVLPRLEREEEGCEGWQTYLRHVQRVVWRIPKGRPQGAHH